MKRYCLIIALIAFCLLYPQKVKAAFSFASIGDAHIEVSKFTSTINQIKNLNPNLIVFNGDLENDGVATSEINQIINVLKNSNLFS